MTLDVRVPISPRPAWFNRVRLIAASIRQFYPDARVRAYIGEPGGTTPDRTWRHAAALPGCDVEWVEKSAFDVWAGTRSEYLATMNQRFDTDAEGDHVLILDADVICTGRFDELLAVDAVQGVQAHVSPLADSDWRALIEGFSRRPAAFLHTYSGAGIMGPVGQMGPWYVNSGVVLLPAKHFNAVRREYGPAIEYLRRAFSDTYWFDQLALAMAVAKARVPAHTVPVRFNFPNQRGFDEALPAELNAVQFIHYLRTDTVDRDRDFESISALAQFCARRDLTGSNAELQARVTELLPCLLPAEITAENVPYA